MEQVQNNGMQELLRTMTQKTLNNLTETVGTKQNEPSEFQKTLERQNQAAQKENLMQAEESKPAENTEQTQKETGTVSEDEKQTLEIEQTVLQQLIAAGIMNFTPVEQDTIPVESMLEDVQITALAAALPDTAAETAETAEAAETAETAESVPSEAIAQPEQNTEVPQVQTMPASPEKAETGRKGIVIPTVETAEQSEHVQSGEASQSQQTLEPVQTEQLVLQTEEPAENPEARPQTEKQEEFLITETGEGAQPVFGQVDEIPVKVGETAAPEGTAQPEPVEKQVEVKIFEALEQGESKVELQLTPEHLGTVKVELTRSADGSLHIVLHAENSQTGSLLEKHSTHLQSLLMTNGQERVQVEVQNAQENQQNQQHQQNFADGHSGNQHSGQQHRHSHRDEHGGQDFLQQLRLGLIPADEEAI